jgi:hypothetical protein
MFDFLKNIRSQRGFASLVTLYAISVLSDWGTSALFTCMGFGECEGNSVVRAFFGNPTEENFWLFARNQLYLPMTNIWQNWIEFAFITMLPFSMGIVLIAVRLSPSFFVKWSRAKSRFLWTLVQEIFLVVILLLISLRFLVGAASNIATIISVGLWAQCLTGNGAVFLLTLCAIALAFVCLLFLERFNR